MRVEEGGALRPRGGADPTSGVEGWRARLRLRFEARGRRTVLASARHEGPLRVQRPFHPEGEGGACHVYVLHPPGGVVGGDRLALEAALMPRARALVTTPGATKLYRARAGCVAEQAQRFEVGDEACLEWLPQETIAYDGARAGLSVEVDLAASATYAGWDIVCLGRPAAGERFERGVLRSELALRRAGRLMFLERGLVPGGDPLLESRWGLGGQPVFGVLVVASPAAERAWVDAVREALAPALPDAEGRFAATLVSGVVVVRFVGASTRAARVLFARAFDVLRPLYAGRPAAHPRIWST